jgi:predicted nucleotidyltransferase
MRSLSVFGSYARAEHEAESDIDLLVEFEQVPSLFGMSRLQARIEERIGVSVDLVTPGGLRRRTLARARDEAVAV